MLWRPLPTHCVHNSHHYGIGFLEEFLLYIEKSINHLDIRPRIQDPRITFTIAFDRYISSLHYFYMIKEASFSVLEAPTGSIYKIFFLIDYLCGRFFSFFFFKGPSFFLFMYIHQENYINTYKFEWSRLQTIVMNSLFVGIDSFSSRVSFFL